MSELRCPNCDVELRPVTAHARSGYLLQLDQCAQCGGLWCDRWELFPLDAAEAGQLDPADQPALWAPIASVKRDLKCPRCRAPLQRFRDPVLPDDARIERCQACEGMWLNRGELRRFKARGAPSARPQPLPDASIQQLVAGYAGAAKWPTVSHLDDAMNAPPAEDEPEDLKRDIVWSAAWIALRTLLRLLLHV